MYTLKKLKPNKDYSSNNLLLSWSHWKLFSSASTEIKILNRLWQKDIKDTNVLVVVEVVFVKHLIVTMMWTMFPTWGRQGRLGLSLARTLMTSQWKFAISLTENSLCVDRNTKMWLPIQCTDLNKRKLTKKGNTAEETILNKADKNSAELKRTTEQNL